MPKNIEIKARCRDFLRQQRIAASLAATPPEVLQQTDTFFVVPQGRLKLRELGSSQGELIFYQRGKIAGPKLSSYAISRTDEPERLRLLLTSALGVQVVVRKRRTIYLVGQTRIHFDQVEGLGDFLELEVVLHDGQSVEDGIAVATSLSKQLDISESDLVAGAYADLLLH